MPNKTLTNHKSARALVVDDETTIADFIDDTLTAQGYQVQSFSDSKAAYGIASAQDFDIALVDISMPGISGAQLSKKIRERSPQTEIIIITGVPDQENLEPFLKMGLTQFLFKPFNRSQLAYSVYAAMHFKRLRGKYLTIAAETQGSSLTGMSRSIRNIRQEILSVSRINLSVLIMGESGTGKEVIAHDVHKNSERSKKPFVPINCATLGSLAESELFGHERGAFTGATKTTNGYIGAANGGTLFFDEIGELAPEIQAKLLRFLDDGEYRRVGSSEIRHADTGIIAATNRDLKNVLRGELPPDLFFRLSGSVIQVSPLRERKADILPLTRHFLTLFGNAKNTFYDLSAEACALLIEEEWPGNTRQLKQVLYKISQTSTNPQLSLADVQKALGRDSKKQEIRTYKEAKHDFLLEFNRGYFITLLSITRGSLQQALQISGMHKKNFYTKIKQLGVTVKDFSPNRQQKS
ncbi:sigma-54-dependent transcriptional regulator [Desulfotalea psychrophila]|uniref:Related to two-component system response regulator (Ntr family) n=1 Tax=Desulfotalea psychrophila (strain LSv54 / DSM 12343) TaxID=177439 RepID=Q6AR25_DESPS|nr:sigma-54 dependent transcriptional regulator [Desulfotalea psychrophila]CAG35199.1 related to two-component system response regulator (Ntr family) [Desulfotalea psychrophila LSv54]